MWLRFGGASPTLRSLKIFRPLDTLAFFFSLRAPHPPAGMSQSQEGSEAEKMKQKEMQKVYKELANISGA
jgi:hypothetical protein